MPACPSCKADIPPDDVNIREAVAHCRACNKVISLAQVVITPDDVEADVAAATPPPRGCRIDNTGAEIRLSAPARSGVGWFFLAFTSFWNVIVVAVFFGAASSSGGPSSSGSTPGGPTTSPSDVISALGLLFFLPFLLVGVGTAIMAIAALCGRVSVTLRADEGEVFTGVRHIGWRRRFSVPDIVAVQVRDSDTQMNNRPLACVSLARQRGKPVRFGTLLTRPRLLWMAGTLRALLARRV